MSERVYKLVFIALLLTQMGVVMGLASPGISDTDIDVVGSNSVHLPVIVSTAVVYMLVLSRLLTDPGRILRAVSSIRLFIPIVLFAILSAAWSTDPTLTLRRALFLVLTSIIALIAGADFEVPELVRMFATASLIHMVLCGLFFAAAPHFLYSPSDPHSLKGLTTHKNIFGFEQGIAVLAFLFVPFRRFNSIRWPLTIAAFVLLVLSRSAGSLVATLAGLCCVPLLLIAHFRGSQRIALAVGGVVALAGALFVLISNASLIPALLSKDSTLTGRTELWALIRIAISHHPLLGYGFDSFWQGLQGDSLTIIRGVGWLVPTAHNGYLDLLLGTGYVGAALLLPPVLQAMIRSLRYLTVDVSPERPSARFFPFAFIVLWLVYNLNESALLVRSGIPFLLVMALSVSLGQRLTANRLAATQFDFQQDIYRDPAPLARGL